MSSEHYFYRRASFRDLPKVEAGARMPTANSIQTGDRRAREDAEDGSRRLRDACLKLDAKYAEMRRRGQF